MDLELSDVGETEIDFSLGGTEVQALDEDALDMDLGDDLLGDVTDHDLALDLGAEADSGEDADLALNFDDEPATEDDADDEEGDHRGQGDPVGSEAPEHGQNDEAGAFPTNRLRLLAGAAPSVQCRCNRCAELSQS